MKLSEHFTLEEMVRSGAAQRMGVDNTPPDEVVANLRRLCTRCLEPLRAHVGAPVSVLSGYRSPAVNLAVRGVSVSQHTLGEGADIRVKGMTVDELYLACQEAIPDFDQLIHEFGRWVHVSYAEGKNRKQLLRAVKEGDKTVYIEYERGQYGT